MFLSRTARNFSRKSLILDPPPKSWRLNIIDEVSEVSRGISIALYASIELIPDNQDL